MGYALVSLSLESFPEFALIFDVRFPLLFETIPHARRRFGREYASVDLRAWIVAEDALALVVESDVTIAAYGVYDRTEGAIRALYAAPDDERHGCASALVDR